MHEYTRRFRDLADTGKMTEAGWHALRKQLVPEGASRAQFEQTRHAFMAGAVHMFNCIHNIMDTEGERTAEDDRRWNSLVAELNAYCEDSQSPDFTEGTKP